MTTYASQTEAPPARVGPSPPASSPEATQPQPTASAATVAYVPPSAVLSGVHHHTPLQPNRHHPLQDNWHDHHARLKATVPSPRLPPPSSQPSQPPHHAKSGNAEARSIHRSHPDNPAQQRSHIGASAPETAHSYHHTVNVVAPHHPGSRLTAAPAHHASYLYPIHQLVTPVAHVPIGAAHYAHLPPSIWNPPHAQYHQHPHPQAHQIPQAHHVSPAVVSTPHGQVPYGASHVHHHVAAPTHLPPHAYALPPPHASATPHPPPPGPPHAVHPGHHPQQHITYAYAQVQAPPSAHHPIKTAVAVSPSEPVPMGGPVSYAMPAAHLGQAPATAVSAPLPTKSEALPTHAPHTQQSRPLPNGVVSGGERGKCYEMNGTRTEVVQTDRGTEDRTDSSSPSALKSRSVPTESVQGYPKESDQRKVSNQNEKQPVSGQPIRKPRKPYTIKKSREVWTTEEHSRFLQALQLYDRDWKKIESYIGTKTVLQIRSHAQKHFGKVTKYKTGEYIPPPRPKKRAALPYPRSRAAGQNKFLSTNGSPTDKTAGSDNGTQSSRDPTSQNRVSAINTSTDAKQGLQTMNGTTNGIKQSASAADTDDHSKQASVKPRHGTTVEATDERRSGSVAYGDKYSSGSYERQNDSRSLECAQREKVPQANGHARWHPPTPSEEPDRERISSAPRASSSSTDIKTGISSYASDPHVHHRGNFSYSEDLGRRGVQYDRRYRHATSHALVNSENNSISRCEGHHSPKRLSSNPSMEHDTSTINAVTRKKMAVPNNSLLVLSNCVDLMSRETLPERQPAAGWATAAAARRAHRAKIIRSRKPPLPQPSIPAPPHHPGYGGKGSPRRELLDADMLGDQSNRQHPVMKSVVPRGDSPSPPVNSPSEYGCDQPLPDPQRSSAGSGTGSDDAIAGFSSSDRPSVSGSAAGSGSGGSLETSDAGEPEEDPKSSNDGSGDDGNRRSPGTRDSSPADPNSSGSRENSPNEFSTPQQSNDACGPELDSASQKSPERNGMSTDKYERESRRNRNDVGYKNLRKEGILTHDRQNCENRHYDDRRQENGREFRNGDEHKLHTLPRTVLSVGHDDQMAPHCRSPRDERGAQIHPQAVHKLSPNIKKRLRPNMDYEMDSRTEVQIGENGRDLPAKRQRTGRSMNEANYSPEQSYHGRDFAERHR